MYMRGCKSVPENEKVIQGWPVLIIPPLQKEGKYHYPCSVPSHSFKFWDGVIPNPLVY